MDPRYQPTGMTMDMLSAEPACSRLSGTVRQVVSNFYNVLREPEEKNGMTHGESVGQESMMERGKTNRRVQRLISEKTDGYAFGILSISG